MVILIQFNLVRITLNLNYIRPQRQVRVIMNQWASTKWHFCIFIGYRNIDWTRCMLNKIFLWRILRIWGFSLEHFFNFIIFDIIWPLVITSGWCHRHVTIVIRNSKIEIFIFKFNVFIANSQHGRIVIGKIFLCRNYSLSPKKGFPDRYVVTSIGSDYDRLKCCDQMDRTSHKIWVIILNWSLKRVKRQKWQSNEMFNQRKYSKIYLSFIWTVLVLSHVLRVARSNVLALCLVPQQRPSLYPF